MSKKCNKKGNKVQLIEEIRQTLLGYADENFAAFSQKLIPTLKREYFIGIRTPQLKAIAKEYAKRDNIDEFLNDLPHKYHEENNLHAFILSGIKNVDEAVDKIEKFLPYINNWSTCDQLRVKCFSKRGEELRGVFYRWVESDKVYTIRFGVGMLMSCCLGDKFVNKDVEKLLQITEDEYYVKMMIAWYLATALAKNYDEVLPYIQEKSFSPWIHNKAIQKSLESFRITDEQKIYLKSLKIK